MCKCDHITTNLTQICAYHNRLDRNNNGTISILTFTFHHLMLHYNETILVTQVTNVTKNKTVFYAYNETHRVVTVTIL